MHSMLFSLVTKLIYVSLLAALPTTAVAMHLRIKERIPGPIIPLVAMAAVCLFGYGAFWAFFATVWLGKVYVAAIYLLSTVYLFKFYPELLKLFWHDRDLRSVWVLMLLIGCSYLAILCAQYKGGDGLVLPAHRWFELPPDNIIPVIFADRLENGISPHNLLGDWLSSDRPPLQTGVILLLRPPLFALGLNHIAVAASQWFQLLWIPGLWALLRTLGATPRVAASIISITACTSFGLLYSLFTWPKLGAAAMILGGLSLILSQSVKSPRERWGIVATLLALGHLSHGGVDFSILALAPLLFWAHWRPDFRSFAVGTLLFGLLITPWMAYQKYYDPPGNRLLKWHLAGVVAIDQRSFSQALTDSYREIGWRGAWQNKIANFRKILDGDFTQIADFSMRAECAQNRRANDEFFCLFRSLSFGNLALLGSPLAVWLVLRKQGAGQLLPGIITCLAWVTLTIIIWCLLMFIPSTTVIHQGSLVTPVILFALPMLLIITCNWYWFLAIAVLQLASFITTWWPAVPDFAGPTNMNAVTLLIFCSAVLLLYICSLREDISALLSPNRHFRDNA